MNQAEYEAQQQREEEEFRAMTLIMQARIYDVLMAIYMDSNETDALRLAEMHKQGHILSPPPSLLFPESKHPEHGEPWA